MVEKETCAAPFPAISVCVQEPKLCVSHRRRHDVVADAGEDREVEVGVAVAFDIGGSLGAEFLWDFGDGTKQEGAEVTHTYDEAGRYAVVLQATGSDGTWKTDSALVTATFGPTDPAPSWSSTV